MTTTKAKARIKKIEKELQKMRELRYDLRVEKLMLQHFIEIEKLKGK